MFYLYIWAYRAKPNTRFLTLSQYARSVRGGASWRCGHRRRRGGAVSAQTTAITARSSPSPPTRRGVRHVPRHGEVFAISPDTARSSLCPLPLPPPLPDLLDLSNGDVKKVSNPHPVVLSRSFLDVVNLPIVHLQPVVV